MKRRVSLILVFVAAAVATLPAHASEERPTLSELEAEIVCPTCRTTLDQSNAPIANRMRAVILDRIEAGDSKTEIKQRLVREFGPEVVQPAPPKRGFNLLAWLLPLAGVSAAALLVGLAAWRWTHTGRTDESRPAQDEPGLDAELERRLDEELVRFET